MTHAPPTARRTTARVLAPLLCCVLLVLPACSGDSTGYTDQAAAIDPALTSGPTATPPPHPTPAPPTSPASPTMSDTKPTSPEPGDAPQEKVELTDAQWKSILSDQEYRILRRSGTEYAGTGRYLDNEAEGSYHCAGCGNKLYAAAHKFHSGCGWPSFFQETEPGAIVTHTDRSFGMLRTEMRCALCDGHLGHIFNDAPDQPTGLRHCVNGNALIFVPEGEDPQQVIRAHREANAGK